MSRSNRRIAMIFMFLLLSISALALSGVFNKHLGAQTTTGLGEERFSWTREVYDGVDLTNIISYNHADQKTYTLAFDPKTVDLKPIVAYGGDAMYGATMSSLIDYEESLGNHVVFGINGDAYDTSNGVANGLVISNGELITSSNSAMGWGMLSDGTVKYGSAKLQMRAEIVDGATITLKHVNKERKQDKSGVYLLTEKFNSVTASSASGVEVVLDIVDEHKDLGLKIGRTLSAKVNRVVQVQDNPTLNQTPIGANQVVLSTHSESSQYAAISALAVGTQINFNVNDVEDDRIDWSEIEVGMGIFHLLMENGVFTNTATGDTAVHPRTSMGVKEDGSIILMQNDGRQFGWAEGLSFLQMAEYMKSLGVVHLFNFDGGGSSTIQVTMPGEDKAKILNRPSDGRERANTNALLFVAKQEPVEDAPVEKLHIYPNVPNNLSTRTLLLEKSNLQFNVKATDRHYYKTSLTGQAVTYSVVNEGSSNIGTISSTGLFTASAGTGKGKVVAKVGDIETSYEIEIVDKITSIETDLTILSIAPGKTIAMDFRAFNNNVPVMLSNESLTFELSDASLGSVSSKGVFTATDGSGTGELTVSYKDFSFSLPVEIGKMPVEIIDFEDESMFSKGWTKYYTNMPGNGGAGEISVNRDERFIKHGDGSLRIDYDFATKPLTGTVAIEIGKAGFITLEGQPTAIGAWVYGDGNGGWFRIQLSGGKYAGDTRIDWVGWKYIETPIPADAPYPYVVQRPVRLLGTATIANNKKGTIYVDSVRAIYDFKNDDNHAPEVVEGSISPVEGATTDDLQEVIKLKVRDVQGTGKIYTGIDTSRTEMYINNKKIDNVQQYVNPDGSVDITYNPGALDRLRPGKQNVRVRVEDNFGNKKFVEWSFNLEGYAVTLEEEVPEANMIYAGQEFEYKLNTRGYDDYKRAEVELQFDASNLELVDTLIDSRLTIEQKEINILTGLVKLKISGMDTTTFDPEIDFINLKFRAKDTVKGTTGIKVNVAKVTETGSTTDLYLEGFDVELDYKYIVSVRGSTLGGNTTLLVTSNGEPVEGVGFEITKAGVNVPLTDKTGTDGTLTTDLFGKSVVGTVFKVRAVKDELKSNETTITIVESLGTKNPEKVVVTVGEDASTSVGIGFQTNHDVKDAKVVIATDIELTNPIEFLADSRVVVTTHAGGDREYTSWGAYVTGLDAGTTYYYKVGTEEGWSEVSSFTTARDGNETNIALFGDIQGGYPGFANIVTKAHAMFPDIDLNLITGDVVDNGHIYQQWTELATAGKTQFAGNIWASTIGNHDTNYDGQGFTSFFYGPNNGVEEPLGGARNYWFEIGDAVIFNFDTEAGFSSYDPGYAKQIELMNQVMNNSDKVFRIVLMHRSAYPLNYNEANIRALAPEFEKAGIDLVLSGHDHVYSRTTMNEGNKVEVQNGVTYVVAGTSAGAKYYDGDPTRPWVTVVYDDNNPVFNMIKLRNGNELVFEAYAVEGTNTRKVDEFTITKSEVDITVSEGATLVGPKFVRTGADTKYTVLLEEGYEISSVKVNGTAVEVVDNMFTLENATSSSKIEVQVKAKGVTELFGDLNADGKVTRADAEILLQAITGKVVLTDAQKRAANLTKDPTLADVRAVLSAIGGN